MGVVPYVTAPKIATSWYPDTAEMTGLTLNEKRNIEKDRPRARTQTMKEGLFEDTRGGLEHSH